VRPRGATLFAYIEGYYNRRRLYSAIGYITPEQAEQNPRNPVSTFPGEGHAAAGYYLWRRENANTIPAAPPRGAAAESRSRQRSNFAGNDDFGVRSASAAQRLS
jgi:hypothetical protein